LTVVSSSVKGANTDHDGVNGTDKVVAPGTKNTTGLTFSVEGTPEVAVKVTFEVEGSDVWLGAGTYPDMTQANTYNNTYEATDTFTATAYYPIKYTLSKQNGTNDDETPKWEPVTNYEGVTLNTIVTYLNTLCSDSGNIYDANTNLATAIGTYKLTWEWDYENQYSANLAVDSRKDDNLKTKGTYDPYDTLLGDLAADKVDGTSLVSTVIGKITTAASTVATEKAAEAAELKEADDVDENAVDAATKAAEAATAVAGISAPTSSTGLEASDKNYSTNADFTITIKVEQVD
jgi:hypothetical protein